MKKFGRTFGQKALAGLLALAMVISSVNVSGLISAKAETTNLVNNPDFEGGSSSETSVPYWWESTSESISPLRAVTDDVHGGSNSGKLSTRTDAATGIRQYITLESSKQYKLTAWVKTAETDTVNAKILYDYWNPGVITSAESVDGAWVKLEATFYTWSLGEKDSEGNDTNIPRVFLFDTTNTNSDLYVDDIVLEEVVAATPTPTPDPTPDPTPTPTPAATNPVQNADFESGADEAGVPYYWGDTSETSGTVTSVTEGVHGGNAAGLLSNREDATVGMFNYLVQDGLENGKQYKVTAWVKADSADTINADIRYNFWSDDTVASVVATAGEWVLLEGTFTTRAATEEYSTITQIVFDTTNTNTNLYVDDVTIEAVTGGTDTVTDYDETITFEDGQTYFGDRGNGTGTVVTGTAGTEVYEGTQALKVSGRTDTWHGVEKKLDDAKVQGKTLKGSFYVKSATAATYMMSVSYDKDGGTTYLGIAEKAISADTWTEVPGADGVDIPSDATNVTLYFQSSDATAEFTIDNVKFSTEEAQAPAKGNISDGPWAPFETKTVDFETQPEDAWNIVFEPNGAAKLSVTPEGHNGSNYALSITDRKNNWDGAVKDLSQANVTGKKVKISFWVRNDGTAEEKIFARIDCAYSDKDTTYNELGSKVVPAGDWVQITGEYTVPTGATPTLCIAAGTATESTTPFTIDDVTVEVITPDPDDGEWGAFTSKIIDFEKQSLVFGGNGSTLSITTPGYGGSNYALKVTDREANWEGPVKSLANAGVAGKIVKISYMVRNDGDATAKAFARLDCAYTNKDTTYNELGSKQVAAKQWAQVTGQFTVPADAIPTLCISMDDNSTPFTIDDVKIEVITPDPDEGEWGPFTSKYIDFEKQSIIFGGNGSTLNIVSPGHNSNYALDVTDREAGWEGPIKDLSKADVTGKKVKISFWAKNNSNSAVKIFARLDCAYADKDTTYNELGSKVATPGQWVQITGEYVVPEGASPTLCISSENATAPFTIDDVQIDVVPDNYKITSSSLANEMYIGFDDGEKFFENRGGVNSTIVTDNHDGGYALAVTGRTEAWMGVQKNITAGNLAGSALNVNAWVKNTSNRNININATLEYQTTSGETKYEKIVGLEVTPGSWEYMLGGINIPKNAKNVVIFFESDDKTASFIIDSVKLKKVGWGQYEVAPSVYPFSTMLINFEDGKKFFTGRGSTQFNLTGDAHAGSKALAITGRNETWMGVEKDFSGSGLQGKGLKASFWVKNTSGTTAEFAMGLAQEKSSETTYARIAGGTVAPGQWAFFEGEINIDKNTNKPFIFFDSTDAYASFIIDDILLTKTAWIEGLGGATGETIDPFTSITIDFEDGERFFDPRGGTKVLVNENNPHGGSKCLSISNRSYGWEGCEKNLIGAALAGKNLSVDFWARNDTNEPMVIGASLSQDFADGSVTYSSVAADTVQPGEWVRIQGDLNVDPNTTKPVLYFECNIDTGMFSLDDITMVTGEAIDNTVGEFESMIIDFEDGNKFFDKRGAVKLMITEDAHESTKALYIGNRTDGWMGAEKDISNAGAGGKVLKASFWVKHDEELPQEIALSICEVSEAGEAVYSRIAGIPDIPAGEWVQITGEFYPDISAAQSVIYFEATEPTASFIIDDVELSIEEMSFVKKNDKDKEEAEDATAEATENAEKKGLSPWLWLLTIPVVAIIGGVVFFVLKKKKLI